MDNAVVVGSRFVPGGSHHGPRWRGWASRIFGYLCNAKFGPGPIIRDWTSGYRVFPVDATAVLVDHDFTTRGHTWQAEVLAVCLNAGFSVVEVPITYASTESSFGWKDVMEAWRFLLTPVLTPVVAV